uniref:Fatty acid 2-hydroxylase (Trinotate prediction) n=1 Tax=Henneguya salminicola TaxID=69463 RepID=A0A6G3MF53_HENSL
MIWFDRKEVSLHCKLDDSWIIYKNSVYDITDFIEKHPGGSKILKSYLGQDITDVMSDASIHSHSNYAFHILEEYKIGSINPAGVKKSNSNYEKKSNEINMRRGILNQLHLVKKDYQNWVYQPITGAVRIFDSDILEFFTRSHWTTVPIFWTPIIVFITLKLYKSLNKEYNFFFQMLFLFGYLLAGILNWSLMEYILHRYLFHLDTNDANIWVLKFHFTIHGLHHKVYSFIILRLQWINIVLCFLQLLQ